MEPERRIEKWLRTFAKKRREQAGEPMQMRPAMRQRLQREIARQSEEKSRGGFLSHLFFGLRPRLVFAACFAALAIGGLFLWHESTGPRPATLTMNKVSNPEMLPNEAAPETPPPAVMSPVVANADKKALEEKQKIIPTEPQPTSPIVASANRSLAVPPGNPSAERDRADNTSQHQELAVTTTAASVPAGNTTLAFRNETAADSLMVAGAATKDTAGELPTAAPSVSGFTPGTIAAGSNVPTQTTLALQRAFATPGSTSTALFDAAKPTGAITVSQIFNRLETSSTRRSVASALKAPVKVLTSFRVEQNGNNMKVVDADGSVYLGSIQIAQQEPPTDYAFGAAKNAPAGAPKSAKAPAPPQQSYFFRVAGTNRNLNENVIFSGNFIPYTNRQPIAGTRGFGGLGGGIGNIDQTAGQPVQAVLSNSEINGNVVIGNQKAIDVIATPQH